MSKVVWESRGLCIESSDGGADEGPCWSGNAKEGRSTTLSLSGAVRVGELGRIRNRQLARSGHLTQHLYNQK